MSELRLQNVTKAYGETVAVKDVSLTVGQGELVALLGPSGCGKTTTLRMVAGFVRASEGTIRIGDHDVTHVPPHKRNTGMVFQGYALFPHMKVAENVAFGLQMRKVSKSEAERRVAEALRLVRLEGYGERYPRQLSGGQQQRVALARALVVEPEVFLLDEPLSNLDAKLRHEVRLEIRQLQRALGLTTVFVTHDQEEALTVADRLVVMSEGVVEQIGTPEELYDKPQTPFVADFIGKSNIFEGVVTGERVFTTGAGAAMDLAAPHPEGPITVAVRPEKVRLQPGGEAEGLPGAVVVTTFLGATLETVVRLDTGDTVTVHTQNTGEAVRRMQQGERVMVTWDPDATLVLGPPR
ncbi:MAG: ABC transporter ATP-binding protein [Devosia sp.]